MTTFAAVRPPCDPTEPDPSNAVAAPTSSAPKAIGVTAAARGTAPVSALKSMARPPKDGAGVVGTGELPFGPLVSGVSGVVWSVIAGVPSRRVAPGGVVASAPW